MSRHELPRPNPDAAGPRVPHPDTSEPVEWDDDLLAEDWALPAPILDGARADDAWAAEQLFDPHGPPEEWAAWSPTEVADDEPLTTPTFPELAPIEEWVALSYDEGPPIIGLVVGIRVEGRWIDAHVDPRAPSTTWVAPGLPVDVCALTVVVGDTPVLAQVERAPAQRERFVLGRDVLAGRFLIRP